MSSPSGLSLKNLPLRDISNAGLLSPESPSTPTSSSLKGLGALASKVTTVLSTSYSDAEFRDALALLDQRGVKNDAETRRQIRLGLQKEVIDSNGEIIDELGSVAEVRMRQSC